MAQPTTEELDKALRESGFKRDANDPDGEYYRTGNGTTEKRYTDGGYSRDRDNSTYTKHQNGDQY